MIDRRRGLRDVPFAGGALRGSVASGAFRMIDSPADVRNVPVVGAGLLAGTPRALDPAQRSAVRAARELDTGGITCPSPLSP